MNLVIRQERIRNGWTQNTVAKALGLTKSAYRNIEVGIRKPSYAVLVKLEDLFALTHRQLFAVADDAPDLSPP